MRNNQPKSRVGSRSNRERQSYEPGFRKKAKKSYKPEYAARAKKMCELGAVRAELADEFDVDITTIDYWLITEADFAEACRTDGEGSKNRIRRAMFERGRGHEYISEKIVRDHGGSRIVEVRTAVPPDPAAAKLFLESFGDENEKTPTVEELEKIALGRLFDQICGSTFEPIEEPPRQLPVPRVAETKSGIEAETKSGIEKEEER